MTIELRIRKHHWIRWMSESLPLQGFIDATPEMLDAAYRLQVMVTVTRAFSTAEVVVTTSDECPDILSHYPDIAVTVTTDDHATESKSDVESRVWEILDCWMMDLEWWLALRYLPILLEELSVGRVAR